MCARHGHHRPVRTRMPVVWQGTRGYKPRAPMAIGPRVTIWAGN